MASSVLKVTKAILKNKSCKLFPKFLNHLGAGVDVGITEQIEISVVYW